MHSAGKWPIPVLSFFTGAGFLDTGFHRVGGFRLVWHNEYNQRFVDGFRYAMERLDPEWKACVNTDSVECLSPEAIRLEAFGGETADLFGIIGGPPCPDFSVGGKNRGEHGENGRLSQVYVDRIMELKPTFFLFENVPGLERTEKHRQFLHRLIDQLSALYVVDKRTLNALEFGVPQDRDRVFLVGFRRDLFDPTDKVLSQKEFGWFDWPEPPFKGAKSLPWPRRNPFRETPDAPPSDLPRELTVAYHIGDGTDDRGLSGLPNQQDQFAAHTSKFEEIAEGDDSRKSFKRLHRYRYSPTAAYGNNEVHLHPFLPRRLSVREAMRLQSVPDEYELPPELPLSYKFKMVSNGVPVRLAEAMAKAIRNCLERLLP